MVKTAEEDDISRRRKWINSSHRRLRRRSNSTRLWRDIRRDEEAGEAEEAKRVLVAIERACICVE